MRHSEQLNEIAAALAKAQGKVKSAIKANTNPHFRSKYADLASVKDACADALSANDIAVVQAHGFEGDRVVMFTRLIHKSGQWLESVYPIKPVKDDPQGLASATTYARRISLSSMVGVVADEDDDGNAASQTRHDEPRRESPAPRPEADNRVKAEQWAFKSIEFIENCMGASEIDAYYGQNSERLAKLQKVHPDLFKQVQAAITAQREFVNVKDAAE